MHTCTTVSPHHRADIRTGARALTDADIDSIIDGAVHEARAAGGIMFVRQEECQRRLGGGRSKYYMDMAAGEITPSITVGRMAVRPSYEISAILSVRLAGAGSR